MKNSNAIALKEFYQDGLDSLSDGTFDLFEKQSINRSDLKIQRVMAHLKVKWHMFHGKFKEAITRIKKTRSQYGDHVGLTCDLASLYYTTGQYALWTKTVKELEKVLQEEIHLSQDSYVKTMFLLAKFQEEQGCVSKSYATLMKIENQATDVLKLRIHANLLRLDTFYKIANHVTTYYHEIKQALYSDLGHNTHPEIVHSLMLAEVEILGIDKLERNFLQLQELKMLSEDDLLVMVDMVLLLSQRKIEIPEWMIERIKKIHSDHIFEQKVIDYALGNSSFTEGWGEWAAQMPLAHFFHLSFFLNESLPSLEKKSLSKQVTLLTQQLPSNDQKYWRSFLAIHEDLRLSIDCQQDEKTIKVDSVYIPMRNKKILFEVLVLLVREKKMTLSQIVENIFQSEFNESYYHRIRRLVKRINDEFEAKLLPPPLQCDKDFLILCKKYQSV